MLDTDVIFLIKKNFYCCSNTVVSIFPPPQSLHPSHPQLPPSILPPLASKKLKKSVKGYTIKLYTHI